MAKASQNYNPDLLPSNTVVEVVKLDKKGEFVGMKLMSFGDWKQMARQPGFDYRAFQKGFSKFKKQ